MQYLIITVFLIFFVGFFIFDTWNWQEIEDKGLIGHKG